MSDDYHPTDLEDAIIEDTVHCCVCGLRMTLGNDLVVIDGAKVKFAPGSNGVFCGACAQLVHEAYLESCEDAGLCEHGNDDDLTCEACLEKYKVLRFRYERKAER